MTKVLVFGADSLVGTHFVSSTQHTCRAAGRSDPRSANLSVAKFDKVDLCQTRDVASLTHRSQEEVVVNFAAATNVDGVERERPRTAPEQSEGEAFTVNALAPEAMAKATCATGRFLISISTDFVFDGTAGPYAEAATPDPFSPKVSWYGWTKGEGERRIRLADPAAAIVRIAYPYRSNFSRKSDFARRLLDQYRSHSLPPLFTDQEITPTWIPDVSLVVEHLIRTRASGTFHVASPEVTSPHRFGRELLGVAYGSIPDLAEGSMEEFLKRPGVTPRPRRGGLSCRRLLAEGLRLTTWQEGIRQLVAERGGTA